MWQNIQGPSNSSKVWWQVTYIHEKAPLITQMHEKTAFPKWTTLSEKFILSGRDIPCYLGGNLYIYMNIFVVEYLNSTKKEATDGDEKMVD